ncbi:hypothetical protein ACFRMQ_09880 [Kitasatospora sp. NPDC056783]|uniref:hypothetical protein n=1 Tax=Kitasatospora sp. NPDC056783 TaxID=3345943 RepID=UPI0036CCC52E
MKPFSAQRLGAILAALLGLGVVFAAQPASATTPPGRPVTAAAPPDHPITGASFSVDKKTAAPGDVLTLTLSLTNTETLPITFAYEYISPSWPANQYAGAFDFLTCSGDLVDCTIVPGAVAFHPTVPIAPGATRTVTATVRITPTPPWTGTLYLNWVPYVYAEYGLPAVSTGSGPYRDNLPELQTVIS